MVGKVCNVGGFSEYDEYVPMVDKAVDSGSENQMSHPNQSVYGG